MHRGVPWILFLILSFATSLHTEVHGNSLRAPKLIENSERQSSRVSSKSYGRIVVWDPAIKEVVNLNASIEKLAGGFQWTEGPAWDVKRNRLYFSDVPRNKAYVWSERNGLQTFLDPSGIPRDKSAGFREPGSNGLLIAANGKLLIANHGRRAIQSMDLDTKIRKTIVSTYRGKKFNSPNDLVQARNGDIYFTDPPFGLEKMNDSPLKELPFNGVFRYSFKYKLLTAVSKFRTFPNGIGLSPCERYLYVALLDKRNPYILKYTKGIYGEFQNPVVWFDTSPYLAQRLPGLPDGMTVSSSGHVFATGPGGVFIISPKGKALGQIRIGPNEKGQATANCGFGGNGKMLYITSKDSLVRIPLLVGRRL